MFENKRGGWDFWKRGTWGLTKRGGEVGERTRFWISRNSREREDERTMERKMWKSGSENGVRRRDWDFENLRREEVEIYIRIAILRHIPIRFKINKVWGRIERYRLKSHLRAKSKTQLKNKSGRYGANSTKKRKKGHDTTNKPVSHLDYE